MHAPTTPTLVDVLLAKFHGRILIPFLDAIDAIGINHQTARNKLHRGVFPVPTMLQGGRRFIAVTDLAAYLEQLYAAREKPKQKKKIGRPTKAELVAAKKSSAGSDISRARAMAPQ